MATKDQERYLEINQFRRLETSLNVIGGELSILNATMSKLVDILDEISQVPEEEPNGPAEQGGPTAPTDHTG